MDVSYLKPGRALREPVYLQLYRRYREAIATGRLQAGERVPSIRSLASELDLSRGTVELAYQMLVSEGYFLAQGPAGTMVSPHLTGLRRAGDAGHGAGQQTPPEASPSAPTVPSLQLGLPALDAFPRKTWVRLAGQAMRGLDAAAMAYPDPVGHVRLREAIAAYLGISRGIACRADQVFVTVGYWGTLALICRTLLPRGSLGWYEEPGYRFARDYLQQAGMRLVPASVYAQGLAVGQAIADHPEARFAVVTPTHQSPLGVTLSLARRFELLNWAHDRHAWIIEDDYDSEFRYRGRPLPALKSLDDTARVLYTGTFSKVLFPGLRLAYLVVPADRVAAFRTAAQHLPGPGAVTNQLTVAHFMAQGHFARHLRAMRSLYAVRRDYLLDALAQTFAATLPVRSQAGGLQLLAEVGAGRDDRRLAAAARRRGLAIEALNDWRFAPLAAGGLLMGFANLQSPEQARAAVRRLHAALREA